MSQYPYDQQPEQPQYPGQPYDAPPQPAYPQQPAYPPQQQPVQPAYGGPGYPRPAYYAPPAPVQVNVNQYAGGPVVVRKKVNHFMHFCLTMLTGGLWLFVWIPAAMRGGKTRVYR